MGLFSIIRPSSPLPDTYKDLPEDMDDWGCAHWKTYYERLKSKLGKSKAVEIVNLDISNIGWFNSSELCKYNCEWARFFKNEGLDTGSNIFSNVYCAATGVTETIVNVTDTAKDITEPKFVKTIIIIAGLAGAGFLAYKLGLFKKLKK